MTIAVRTLPSPTPSDDARYPSSDGKPMAEDSKHRVAMTECIDGMQLQFAERKDVYISGNDFLYYEEGNPLARVSPDAYFVEGVDKRYRPNFKVWQEGGRSPSVVFEFTSRKTKREDIDRKYRLYEQILKVEEYFLFDPDGDYLRPRLQGYRLLSGRYEPIPLLIGPFSEASPATAETLIPAAMPVLSRRSRREPIPVHLYSERLGLWLVASGERLRFWDPLRSVWLKNPSELLQEAKDHQARAALEATARTFAEQRAALEIAARAGAEQRAALEATARAEAEQRAEVEAGRNKTMEEEMARLRAEIEQLHAESKTESE